MLDQLPVDRIVALVRDRRAAVIVAPPGAGKTTRIPPALIEDGPVLLLQPRRVAARAIARYVAQHLPSPTDDPAEMAKKPIEYRDATLLKVWVLAFGGKDEPGTIHAGTLPGGLFTSRDGGDNWELNRPLWNHPSRGGDLFAGPATSRNEWGGTPAAVVSPCPCMTATGSCMTFCCTGRS